MLFLSKYLKFLIIPVYILVFLISKYQSEAQTMVNPFGYGNYSEFNFPFTLVVCSEQKLVYLEDTVKSQYGCAISPISIMFILGQVYLLVFTYWKLSKPDKPPEQKWRIFSNFTIALIGLFSIMLLIERYGLGIYVQKLLSHLVIIIPLSLIEPQDLHVPYSSPF